MVPTKYLRLMLVLLFAFASSLLITSCGADDSDTPVPTPDPEPVLSSEKAITLFSFAGLDSAVHTTISGTDIAATVTFDTDVTTLIPTFVISADATVIPESGVAQDFSGPVTYTLTAEDESTQDYIVIVTVEAAPPILSDFETGTDEWKIEGDAQGGQGGDIDPEFSPVDGVDNSGHIFAKDDVAGGTWYFVAPSKFRGDKSQFMGGKLTYFLTQSDISNQFNNKDIIITSGSEGIVYRYPNQEYPGTEWTEYAIPLDESGAWVDLDENPVTNDQIQRVLSNITKLSIRGEFRTGADTGRLDSFAFAQ